MSLSTLSLVRVAMLSSIVTLAIGCDRPEPAQSTPPAQKEEAASSPSPPKLPNKPAEPASVREAIDAVASGCKLDEKYTPKACTQGELRALRKFIARERVEALPGLLDALDSEDEQVRHVAGYVFKSMVPMVLGDAAELDYTIRGDDKRVAPLDTKLAERMLATAKSYDPDTDHMAALTLPATVDMATLAGLDDEVRALLAGLDPDASEARRALYYEGMKRLMRFGRMRFFQDVQAMANHEVGTLQLIAFEAPMMMSAWDNGESDRICTWAGEMLREDKPAWNAGPARLMLRCNNANTWRNILLDEATRRYASGRLEAPFTSVLCRVCAPAVHNLYPAGGKTVCERGEQLFERLTLDKERKLDMQTRKQLLRCMSEQWSGSATLSHLEVMSKDKEEQVAKLASELLSKLAPKKP